MNEAQKPHGFVLTLRPVPSHRWANPETRLKFALRRLLRDYGLRCEICKPESSALPVPAVTPAKPDTSGTSGHTESPIDAAEGNLEGKAGPRQHLPVRRLP